MRAAGSAGISNCPRSTSNTIIGRETKWCLPISMATAEPKYWSITCRSRPASGGSLMCFEQNGKLRWQARYGGLKTFGGRTFDASYCGRFVRPVRVGGRPLLLTVANHHLWYPSQVALRAPRTGRVVE